MPSHHQSAFFQALRETGFDVAVRYFGDVDEKRLQLGWDGDQVLPQGERHVHPDRKAVESCPDWRQRLHIVPGYGNRFLRQLVKTLVEEHVPWMHWSEPAHPGIRWWLSLPVKRWFAQKVNRHASGALAIGEMARKDFIRWGIKSKKIDLLTYAVEGLVQSGKKDQKLLEFGQGFSVCFVFVGALCRRKGTDLLIKAFGLVSREYPSAGLALVGKDSGDADYRALAREHVKSDNIFFRGSVKAYRIASVIEAGNVLVLPSRFDGWGMTLNEGASLGRALIGTDRCGSAHHLIREGENGFVVSANNVQSLADAISQYASDPELAKEHGMRSRQVFADYTPEVNAQRLVDILTLRGRSLAMKTEGFNNP